MSYAVESTSIDPLQQREMVNHFVIFDPLNVFACHDFEVPASPYSNLLCSHDLKSCLWLKRSA